jgi:isopenicillin-N N-acyltransferase-like protein
MRMQRGLGIASFLVFSFCATFDSGGEPFRFPQRRHGAGELRYINGLPVLTVGGTREEMGEQVGVLALKPSAALVEHFHDYLRKKNLEKIAPVIYAAAEALYQRFPEPYRREMEAMIQASGRDRDLIILGNTAFDLSRLIGCTGILVGAERSATSGPLYGRNFDFPFDDLIAEYSLVIVYRPEGKKAFAMVTFPGLLASNSGINERGLTLGANTVKRTGDGAPPFDPSGMPYTAAAREVMEDCGSVEEFDRWIRSHSRTGMGLLLACDPRQQRIFEITTKNIGVREPEDGLLYCTNHFRVPPMAVKTNCRRYAILENHRSQEKFSVQDVARLLNDVNQGKRTMQTMVFEPEKLLLHLSLGRGPTSARPLKTLDLKPLLKKAGD